MVNITTINLQALATSLPYITSLQSFNSSTTPELSFHEYSPEFTTQILGPQFTWRKVANESYQAFHEAGIYDRGTKSLYISSNWAGSADNPINVSVVSLEDFKISSRRYAGLASPNGGRTFVPPGGGGNAQPQMLWADEGDLSGASALTILDPATGTTKVSGNSSNALLEITWDLRDSWTCSPMTYERTYADVNAHSKQQILNNYNGRNFSSINDVVQHTGTGDIWFTDAQYGWLQYFRPEPQMPNQVYRFEPQTGRVQVVADGFAQSNGIEFAPDLRTLYVTDTGAFLSSRGGSNATGPATIYAFDVVDGVRLANRRMFAYIDNGAPDGIHTDVNGNVYSSCGDGVRVWNADGKMLGIMRVQGGSANFAFVPGGIMIFNEYRLFLVNIMAKGREVDRDFGPPG